MLKFEFCCDDPLFQLRNESFTHWGNHSHECKTIDVRITATFSPASTFGAETVKFHYSVAYLFVNQSHFQWWNPDGNDLLPFEVKITGIDKDGCRPDMSWERGSESAWDVPVFAFPSSRDRRQRLKSAVQNIVHTVRNVCRTKAGIRLLFRQNSTGYVTLPIPDLIKTRKYTNIGGSVGVGTFFPRGFTVCLKFQAIGRQPIYLNSFGHLSILHWGISMMTRGTALDKSFWSGSVYYARLTNQVSCLVPPQESSLMLPSPSEAYKGLNYLIVDGVNVKSLQGENII